MDIQENPVFCFDKMSLYIYTSMLWIRSNGVSCSIFTVKYVIVKIWIITDSGFFADVYKHVEIIQMQELKAPPQELTMSSHHWKPS